MILFDIILWLAEGISAVTGLSDWDSLALLFIGFALSCFYMMVRGLVSMFD